MRVIAGFYKGRRLERIQNDSIRPTSDRVKEALFSILGEKIINCRFLDLFAGSGGIGIEAMSRGAEEVIFIDSSWDSIKILKNNLKNIGLEDKAEVYNTSYTNGINKLSLRKKQLDIIYVDPPYKSNFSHNALKRIFKDNILAEYGIIILEHSIKESLEEEIVEYKLFKKKTYGNTQLLFYT